METGQVTDHDLMNNVRNGDCNSLGVLFERHHRKLFNYFLKHTGNRPASEDMVQDTFLRILKYRRSYQGGDNGFGVWLYRIARNVRFDFYGKKGPPTTTIEDAVFIADDSPPPDLPVEQADEAALVRQALASLPDNRRELIIMSKYQNMPYRDIARVLDCTEGAVKVRVHRALKELAEHYHHLTGETCHEM